MFASGNHSEEDRGADKGKDKSLSDFLPVLCDVLLAQDSQVNVDKDEKAAKQSTYYTDNDGCGKVEQT